MCKLVLLVCCFLCCIPSKSNVPYSGDIQLDSLSFPVPEYRSVIEITQLTKDSVPEFMWEDTVDSWWKDSVRNVWFTGKIGYKIISWQCGKYGLREIGRVKK